MPINDKGGLWGSVCGVRATTIDSASSGRSRCSVRHPRAVGNPVRAPLEIRCVRRLGTDARDAGVVAQVVHEPLLMGLEVVENGVGSHGNEFGAETAGFIGERSFLEGSGGWPAHPAYWSPSTACPLGAPPPEEPPPRRPRIRLVPAPVVLVSDLPPRTRSSALPSFFHATVLSSPAAPEDGSSSAPRQGDPAPAWEHPGCL